MIYMGLAMDPSSHHQHGTWWILMPDLYGSHQWDAYDFLMLFAMWAVMMAAMMTPSALPMLLVFNTVNRSKKTKGQPHVSTLVFLMGYLIAWSIYAAIAAATQWPLQEAGLLDPYMTSQSYLLSGIVLIIAGVYQWTPLKDACLHQCRTPLNYMMSNWRSGTKGALVMGIRHGLYCIGCCWALMALMFAIGVMNLLWMAIITIFSLIEKLLSGSSTVFRSMTGIIFVAWGLYWVLVYSGMNN